MVSTMTDSFFRQHFEAWGQERLWSCHWLGLRVSNGLAIPYLGYLEFEVKLCGRLLPRCGVLVVKDPLTDEFPQASGVLAMNILQRCYRLLFGHHGPSLFNLTAVTGAPETVVQALQTCHQAKDPPAEAVGKIKVRGKKACRIPGGTIQVVLAIFSDNTLALLCSLSP